MKLAETEYRVMNLIWADEGISAKNLAEALGKSIGWSKTTTYTIITRCIQKGYIHRAEPRYQCYSVISRSEIGEGETDTLIDHYYGGRPERLVESLLSRGKLTAAELADLSDSE